MTQPNLEPTENGELSKSPEYEVFDLAQFEIEDIAILDCVSSSGVACGMAFKINNLSGKDSKAADDDGDLGATVGVTILDNTTNSPLYVGQNCEFSESTPEVRSLRREKGILKNGYIWFTDPTEQGGLYLEKLECRSSQVLNLTILRKDKFIHPFKD